MTLAVTQGQETAMRLVVSSRMTILICLCVGSLSTLVSTLWGICAQMLSADTVLDMVDVYARAGVQRGGVL